MLGNGFLFGDEANFCLNLGGTENANVGELALYREANEIVLLQNKGAGSRLNVILCGDFLTKRFASVHIVENRIDSHAIAINCNLLVAIFLFTDYIFDF